MKNESIDAYYSKCLRTDLPSAIKELFRGHATDKRLVKFRCKVSLRFIEKSERFRAKSQDPFVNAIVVAYRSYYRDALLMIKTIKQTEIRHEKVVRDLVHQYGLKISSKASWEKYFSKRRRILSEKAL